MVTDGAARAGSLAWWLTRDQAVVNAALIVAVVALAVAGLCLLYLLILARRDLACIRARLEDDDMDAEVLDDLIDRGEIRVLVVDPRGPTPHHGGHPSCN